MKTYKLINKRGKNAGNPVFKLFFFLGFTFIVSLLIAMKMKYEQTGKAIVPETYLATGIIFLMALMVGVVARYIFKKAESLPHSKITKWLIPTLAGFYMYTFISAYFSVAFGVFSWFLVNGYPLNEYIPNLTNEFTGIDMKNIFGWLLLFTIVMFFFLWQKSARKEQKLQEENLRYRYLNLKSQVNPHFLFNSLNTLSELVYEDAKKADHYIQKLSGIYRYILEHEEIDLIPLSSELEFVKQYVDIQKTRDNDKIKLLIDVPYADQCKVVPVSLQTLVENALKHNARSEKSPLIISIKLNDGKIRVCNNIQRKNSIESFTKKGLHNLKERVKHTINKEIEILEENNHFIVQLPYLNSAS